MKKCLWVLPKDLFPIQDGARVANFSLMKSIRPFFVEFDILIFSESDKECIDFLEYKKKLECKSLFVLKKKSQSSFVKKIFTFGVNAFMCPGLPASVGGFASKKDIKYINENILINNYELIVFDGLHPYSAFKDFLNKFPTDVIYRAHNVENNLWISASLQSKGFILSKLLSWQSRKMKKFELDLINRARKVWNISEDDLKIFGSYSIDFFNKLVFVPVGFDFYTKKDKDIDFNSEPIKLLFIGKLDWAPNIDGLKWFLENVWPFINIQKIELVIGGSGNASWGKELFKLPGVKFVGFVQDLDDIYSEIDFSIIPIRFGSGTRIKVLESVSRGVPVISTHMGIQGSGLKDYIWAENSADWIKTLSSLNISQGSLIAKAATLDMEKCYSPEAIGMNAYHSLLQ